MMQPRPDANGFPFLNLFQNAMNPFQNIPSQGMNPFQGGLQGGMKSYFGGLDVMTQSYDPYFKGLARWQLEAMGLMSRRAQAYLEISSRMSKCRTPQDLFAEQTRFWQTAFQQYSESTRRMMAAANQMAVLPPTMTQAMGGGKTKRERDYISFPDAKAPASAASQPSFPQPTHPTQGGPGKPERRVA